ncbi:MAG: GH3 auxin-responsive promoter family protein [Phycisphaeraceae bacterium]|nr:GH3 auxin-responsive promoter family protein [Phycisphaeraceae bacterium]
MHLLEWIVQRILDRREAEIQRARRDPAKTQSDLLLSLLHAARKTEFGRKHGFRHIRSVDQYQSQVPIGRYEQFDPLWRRALDGERDVTWPGRIRYFALTSGTTTGSSKVMPVSGRAIRYNVISGKSLCCAIRPWIGPRFMGGPSLYFGGCTRLRPQGRALIGDASGIASRHVPRIARRHRLPAQEISDLDDWEQKVNLICTRYLDAPVQWVVGLPSWTLILFRHLIDHAQAAGRPVETVIEVWKNLKAFVHFGMAFEPYRRAFEQMLGAPIPMINTYSSSEGGMNAIQWDPADPTMTLELDTGTFYEFVPVEELNRPDPTRLTLDEVQVGPAYAVILTTASGIWAYDIGDAIRFTRLDPPGIVFASRTAHQLNTLGEHVIEEHLESAMADACQRTGLHIEHYMVWSETPTANDPRGFHDWLVEFTRNPDPDLLARFARILDQNICRQSDDYAAHRANGFGMALPLVSPVPKGTFYRWLAQQGKLGGQHKLTRIPRTAEIVRQIRELAGLPKCPRHASPWSAEEDVSLPN